MSEFLAEPHVRKQQFRQSSRARCAAMQKFNLMKMLDPLVVHCVHALGF